jgi:hypothetical protein
VFEDELHRVVVTIKDYLRLEALQRWEAALTVELLVERLGDLLAVLGVLVGGSDRRRLETVVLEAACRELADVGFDNVAGVFDVLEPVHVVAAGLGDVPDGSVAWRVCTEL